MKTGIVSVACMAGALLSAPAGAGIQCVAIGDAPRPSSYAGRPLTPFGPDMRPVFTEVSSILGPGQREMWFLHPMSHRQAGSTYFGWGRDYHGDLYYSHTTAGAYLDGTIVLPPYTTAIVVYASNGGFGVSPTTFTCSDGIASSQIHGDLNTDAAIGFAFYATEGSVLKTIKIDSIVCPFALGEFMIKTEGTGGCAADLNGDGFVDFADYLEFLNRFEALDLMVDFNQDRQIDFSDYLEFLNAYDAGC